jgi:hypothetical protein
MVVAVTFAPSLPCRGSCATYFQPLSSHAWLSSSVCVASWLPPPALTSSLPSCACAVACRPPVAPRLSREPARDRVGLLLLLFRDASPACDACLDGAAPRTPTPRRPRVGRSCCAPASSQWPWTIGYPASRVIQSHPTQGAQPHAQAASGIAPHCRVRVLAARQRAAAPAALHAHAHARD